MYSVGWDGGNIGYRRAQVPRRAIPGLLRRFAGHRATLGQPTGLRTTPPRPIKGEPPNWPIIEGRVAWTVGQRGQGCLPITVGLSGHIGEEEFDHRDHRPRRSPPHLVGQHRPPRADHRAAGVPGRMLHRRKPGHVSRRHRPRHRSHLLNTIRDAGGWCEIWYDWTPCAPQPRRLLRRRSQRPRPAHHRREKLQPVLLRQRVLRSDEELPGRHGSQFVEDDLRRPSCRAIRSAASSWPSTASKKRSPKSPLFPVGEGTMVIVRRGLSRFLRHRGYCAANPSYRRENGTVPLAPREGDRRSMFSADVVLAKHDFSQKNGPVPQSACERLRRKATSTAHGDNARKRGFSDAAASPLRAASPTEGLQSCGRGGFRQFWH